MANTNCQKALSFLALITTPMRGLSRGFHDRLGAYGGDRDTTCAWIRPNSTYEPQYVNIFYDTQRASCLLLAPVVVMLLDRAASSSLLSPSTGHFLIHAETQCSPRSRAQLYAACELYYRPSRNPPLQGTGPKACSHCQIQRCNPAWIRIQ